MLADVRSTAGAQCAAAMACLFLCSCTTTTVPLFLHQHPTAAPQVLSKEQLVGRYGGLLSSMAHLRAFITYPQELQSAALLALTQLMAVDREFCAANVALLFTLLHKR